tara:strand:+ start:416 stop:649 length:234 start_codon:yes stop_codon:yes gene_type:complete
MTDKVKSAIYIYDTIYKRTSRITLQCLLTRINNRSLDTSGTKLYFATMDLLDQFKNKYYKQQWRLDQKTAVQEYFKL